MVKHIINKIKSRKEERIKREENEILNGSHRVYLLNKIPSNSSFLLEASVKNRIYKGKRNYIESITLESGDSFCQEVCLLGTNSITEKQLDLEIKELGLKPLEIESYVFVLDDGKFLEIDKIDRKVIIGKVMNLEGNWKPSKELNESILEDITNKAEFDIYDYWKKTRGCDNRV